MKKLIIALVFITVGSLYFIGSLTYNKFQLSFLDVGQGDSIFVRTPDDYIILIDGGPGANILEALAEVLPLYTRTLDLVVLTHPHADHVNGLVEIVKRYNIKKALLVGTDYENAYYNKMLEVLNEKKIPVIFADSSRDLKVGKYVYLDIIWPTKKSSKNNENVNNASLAMRIVFKDKIIFLGGDAEKEEEKEILESGFEINSDILKAGHHGSRTASAKEFLNSVTPQIVVIQSGKDNKFGHPHAETLQTLFDKGIQIRRNDLEGRIDFIF